MQQYSIKEVYEKLIGTYERLCWCLTIWEGVGYLNFNSVVGWPCIISSQTKAKLYTFGVCADNLCLLCGEHIEDHEHLLFKCHFSAACFDAIKQWCNRPSQVNKLFVIVNWLTRRSGTKNRRSVQITAMIAVVYYI